MFSSHILKTNLPKNNKKNLQNKNEINQRRWLKKIVTIGAQLAEALYKHNSSLSFFFFYWSVCCYVKKNILKNLFLSQKWFTAIFFVNLFCPHHVSAISCEKKLFFWFLRAL